MLVYETDARFIGVPRTLLSCGLGVRAWGICAVIRVSEAEIGFHVRVCFNHLTIFAT